MSNQELIKAVANIKHWRSNPVDFVKDNFGVEPDIWQVRA